MAEQSVDDKVHIRESLDLSKAEWVRMGPHEGDVIERASVTHTDGVTYTLLRASNDPGTVLYYTPAEWIAFVKGVRDGEFDLPA